MKNSKFKTQNSKGVALVAVLAILVVLTILAASFSAMMNLELKQSNEQQNSYQLDMLVEAGLEHAKTFLTLADSNEGQASRLSKDNFSKWLYVKDKTGKISGRYRIKIEDEAAKVNISKAHLLKDGKGTSWDTGEVNLPRALGLPTKFAKKIIRYRYGPNWMPGGRADDDHNNVVLMADGIDNDADGKIDEEDEGINDPAEYAPDNLKGDDRKFTTMSETLSILLASKKELPIKYQHNIIREIPQRATIYSIDKTGSKTLQNEKTADINCVTARECQQRLTTANSKKTFEPNSEKRRQLAANIVDYRDENHVLSTLGSTYGVEAICFNEVMANDESSTYLLEDGNLTPGNDYDFWKVTWEKQYGTSDKKRPIYHVSLPYFAVTDDQFYQFDPRFAWRVECDEGTWKHGSDMKISASSFTITLPDAPGKEPQKEAKMLTYCKGIYNPNPPPINPWPYNKPDNLPCEGQLDTWCKWDNGNIVTHDVDDYTDYYEELMEVLKKRGKADGNRPNIKSDFFKNSHIMIYTWGYNEEGGSTKGKPIGCFEVTKSSGHKITVRSIEANDKTKNIKDQLAKQGMSEENCNLSVCFVGWGNRSTAAHLPKVNTWQMIRSRQAIGGRYFNVVINRQPIGRWLGYKTKELGVSGRIDGGFTEDKTFSKKWAYNNGKPVRTDSTGWIDLLIQSSPEVNREEDLRQTVWYVRMVAPEVSEMYNASASPVSLANWRVICNTGSIASEIGRIKQTAYYDKILKRKVIENNPVVLPGGHFYLVNDTELFDYWYGSGNGKWGSGPKEEVPIFQMDADRWGITYEIKLAKFEFPPAKISIELKGENLKKRDKTFEYETVMFIDEKGKKNPKSWNGIFAPILSELITRNNEIAIGPTYYNDHTRKYMEPGTKIMVLGLPHKGGIVSLTLKNEYEQICARTVDYGEMEPDELGKSYEKIDPTKNNWIKRRKASIAGRDKEALNRAMRSRRNEKFFIKNGPYCSIGETRHVTTGGDFQRLGGGSANISKAAEAMGAIADVMCSSHVRLEAAAGNVSRIGWKEAADEVEASTLSSVTCKNGGWEPNQWKGQTLRFLTGSLRGEKFPIVGNSRSVITLGDKTSSYDPRSAPNRKILKPEKGDKFSVGPAYASALCFTKKGGEEAEWTWKNALPNVGHASRLTMSEANNVSQASRLTMSEANNFFLYIHGLNDAIDTTEFLEENNNAAIDVEVYNYKLKKFDQLCKRKKYGKQDSFNAGKINSNHISDYGDFRLKLIASDIAEKKLDNNKNITGDAKLEVGGKQTGIAWFNYAVITPMPVLGRVNINTAPARLLASLPGINSTLAKNIEKGLNSEGKAKLKPYKRLGNIFKVKGMTPDVFERCANFLTIDSSMFTVEVEAETVNLISKSEMGDENITGSRRKRFIVELEKTKDEFCSIREIERYSP